MESKWRCVSCSHPNWFAASQCTACYRPRKDEEFSGKPLHGSSSRLCDDNLVESFIINQTSPARCRKGKVKMPSGDGIVSTGFGYSSLGRDSAASRWVCAECSAENMNNARLCCQCSAMRPKKGAAAALSLGSASGNAADSCSQSRPRKKPRRAHGREKRPTSTSHASASPAPSSNSKWSCIVCTFSNWPKSLRCAMCSTPRNADAAVAGGSSDHNSQSSSGGEGEVNSDGASESGTRNVNLDVSDSPVVPGTALAGQESADKIIDCTPSTANAALSVACRSSSAGASNSEGRCGRSQQRTSSPSQAVAQHRNRMSQLDTLYLAACAGVAHGDENAVCLYLRAGGDCTRALTSEEAFVLNTQQQQEQQQQANGQGTMRVFSRGGTLVHLALGYDQTILLTMLLTGADAKRVKKRLPSYALQSTADEVRQEMAKCLQQRKGDWPCYFVSRNSLFCLPEDVSSFSEPVRERLLQDVVDSDVQAELEDSDRPVINWCHVITDTLGTKLYALWNRTLGDCLLDSLLLATWGVQDRSASLRIALAESLNEGRARFFERWREAEMLQANSLQYSLDEKQWRLDFAQLQRHAAKSGASLEQMHVFALAHILRRPIVVYGIKYVKSFRGDNLGLARFQGVYLPLLWDPEFCWRSPVTLAYTRGHFSALVPMENCLTPTCPSDVFPSTTVKHHPPRARTSRLSHGPSTFAPDGDGSVAWLPLVDSQGQLLPVHFLTIEEIGREEELLHLWLDCFTFPGCALAARQVMPQQHHVVEVFLDQWLSYYRRLDRGGGSPVDSTAAVVSLAAAIDDQL